MQLIYSVLFTSKRGNGFSVSVKSVWIALIHQHIIRIHFAFHLCTYVFHSIQEVSVRICDCESSRIAKETETWWLCLWMRCVWKKKSARKRITEEEKYFHMNAHCTSEMRSVHLLLSTICVDSRCQWCKRWKTSAMEMVSNWCCECANVKCQDCVRLKCPSMGEVCKSIVQINCDMRHYWCCKNLIFSYSLIANIFVC